MARLAMNCGHLYQTEIDVFKGHPGKLCPNRVEEMDLMSRTCVSFAKTAERREILQRHSLAWWSSGGLTSQKR